MRGSLDRIADPGAARGRSFVLAGTWWAAMFVASIALVDTLALQEVVLGAIGAGVAAAIGYCLLYTSDAADE